LNLTKPALMLNH